ncbi:hypothetical protein [Pinirhizobacter sp.]|uniref:hypothetical protein n=1 Tax=Pinirhizobacter sp. TaxID=2950432 RepID=UPI002F40E86B
MLTIGTLQKQTSLPETHASESDLFNRKEPTTPLSPRAIANSIQNDSFHPSVSRAGWPCFAPRTTVFPAFFAAHNPGTARAEQKKMQQAFASVAAGASAVRREIGAEFVRQAQSTAIKKAINIPMEIVLENQKNWLDPKQGIGMPYTHARDHEFSGLLDDPSQDIHLMLPGYATGDRYSMILAALVEPRLRISVAFTQGDAAEESHAREAYRVLVAALEANGEADPEQRIALVGFAGDLRAARETLDDPATLRNFAHVEGFDSPLGMDATDTHVFHISVSTEILRRQFAGLGPEDIQAKHASFKQYVSNMVSPTDQKIIDGLVERVMKEQGIGCGDVGLWIADRPLPTQREAEAISRPAMFEQIATALEKTGRKVYFVADTFINKARGAENLDVVVNRHKYRPAHRPHIGRFWAAHANGKAILAPRENQWYFMNRLLEKTAAPIIGVRSGALEPLALMGHPTIYLEHKDMFTPERHASWQGHVPYHRFVTDHTTGYRGSATEIEHSRLTATMLSMALKGDRVFLGPNVMKYDEWLTLDDLQEMAVAIETDVAEGVLATSELDVLLAMVAQPGPALQIGRSLDAISASKP